MNIIQIYGRQPDTRAIESVAEVLRRGGIAIIPTDTLYALVCNGLNSKAIEKLSQIKGLTEKHLLSVICKDMSQAAQYARIENKAYRMMKDQLPGPVTYILPAANTLPKAFKGRKTVGIRVPDNDFARAVAQELDAPLMCTSVACDEPGNPDSVEWTYEANPDIELIIKADILSGAPSSIVDLQNPDQPEILRQ
ncbi:MAG: threonylcarbamoyl-AMP synthase [Bacteroidales bacterium]|nr:threonylcarbamoyl-AMP synthase [Bacteroidales bacterium]